MIKTSLSIDRSHTHGKTLMPTPSIVNIYSIDMTKYQEGFSAESIVMSDPKLPLAATAPQPLFRQRCPAGGKNHRHIEPRRVHHRRRCVPGTNDHVNHDDLRLARDHRIALCHAHRHEFMRHRDRHRMHFLIGSKLRQTVNDRPEVGAAVTEKIFDSASAENF